MDFRGLLIVGLLLVQFFFFSNANLVLPVQRKFKGPFTELSAIRVHDARRRGRILAAVDINLGGNGLPSAIGLYYTKLGLGTPPKEYYVQVDTGSDILWVNCAGCTSCPKKSDIGMDLTLFDPKGSSTASLVSCSDQFCISAYDGLVSGCQKNMSCQYSITYADGSATTGIYVKDYLTFNQVNGNLRTAPANSSVVFGCGARQNGTLGSSGEALDGIMGFGQANSSILSQLAASGTVKKIFSHCLDSINGGGIFSIGEVVDPKFNKTSLIQKMTHYNVLLKGIEVDGVLLPLPAGISDSGNGRGTIIDSGTTLAYFPPSIYNQIMSKILARQPGMQLYLVEDQFTCFHYKDNVDEGFPVVKFIFEGIYLRAYPHEYLFMIRSDTWCIGWQKSEAQIKDGQDLVLLGDLVLSNKLVIYDIENMTIGWTEYNCSSSIKVKDAKTGSVYTVGAHSISSASTLMIGRILIVYLLLIALVNNLQ